MLTRASYLGEFGISGPDLKFTRAPALERFTRVVRPWTRLCQRSAIGDSGLTTNMIVAARMSENWVYESINLHVQVKGVSASRSVGSANESLTKVELD